MSPADEVRDVAARLARTSPYRCEFKVRSDVGTADHFEADGEAIQSDTVFSCVARSSGEVIRVTVGAGSRVVVWNPVAEAWVDLEDGGPMINDPRELLSAVEAKLAGAKVGREDDVLVVRFEGEACRSMVATFGIELEAAKWDRSHFEARIRAREGRLEEVRTEGVFEDENTIRTSMELRVVEYGGSRLVRPKGIPMDGALKALGLNPADF